MTTSASVLGSATVAARAVGATLRLLEGALWNFTVVALSDRRASRCARRRDTGAPREAIARVCGMASEVRVRPRTLPSVSYPRGSPPRWISQRTGV
jgi:hypothetical protein